MRRSICRFLSIAALLSFPISTISTAFAETPQLKDYTRPIGVPAWSWNRIIILQSNGPIVTSDLSTTIERLVTLPPQGGITYEGQKILARNIADEEEARRRIRIGKGDDKPSPGTPYDPSLLTRQPFVYGGPANNYGH